MYGLLMMRMLKLLLGIPKITPDKMCTFKYEIWYWI